MKQNLKKIWLVLCMAACMFAISGCGKSEQKEEEISAVEANSLQQGAQQYLDFFNAMTDDLLEQTIATAESNKDTVMASALNAWVSVKDDLGNFVSSELSDVSKSKDGYTAKIHAVYEKRNMEFILMVDEDMAYLTSISFNPVYSLGEKMKKAGMNTLMGMGTVFVILIFISWLISCFKYINRFEDKMKKKKAGAPVLAETPAPAAKAAPTAPAAAEMQNESQDDTELAAVIAAAIAASEGRESAEGLVVRSIRRVPNGNWKRA